MAPLLERSGSNHSLPYLARVETENLYSREDASYSTCAKCMTIFFSFLSISTIVAGMGISMFSDKQGLGETLVVIGACEFTALALTIIHCDPTYDNENGEN